MNEKEMDEDRKLPLRDKAHLKQAWLRAGSGTLQHLGSPLCSHSFALGGRTGSFAFPGWFSWSGGSGCSPPGVCGRPRDISLLGLTIFVVSAIIGGFIFILFIFFVFIVFLLFISDRFLSGWFLLWRGFRFLPVTKLLWREVDKLHKEIPE